MSVETTTMAEKTTTTVNLVLIWRQQAAVAKQEPRISGSGQRAGGGRGGSRKRKINRNKSGYSIFTVGFHSPKGLTQFNHKKKEKLVTIWKIKKLLTLVLNQTTTYQLNQNTKKRPK